MDQKKNLPSGRKRGWRKKNWWVICSIVSVVLLTYIFLEQGGPDLTGRELLRVACDACFICGLVFLCLFVIDLCIYLGAFDFLQYSAGKLLENLSRKKPVEEGKENTSFANFLFGKKGKRRLANACLIFAVGFLLAGAVFLVLWMR